MVHNSRLTPPKGLKLNKDGYCNIRKYYVNLMDVQKYFYIMAKFR